MDKALLDTDILSEVIKGKDANVVARATAYRQAFGRYTLSTFSVVEVVKGHHRIRRPDRIARFLAGIAVEEVLTLSVPAAELAGRLFADLELAGRPIGRMDPLIAAIAVENGL